MMRRKTTALSSPTSTPNYTPPLSVPAIKHDTWTSPHLVDCEQRNTLAAHDGGGPFKQITPVRFITNYKDTNMVQTLTERNFEMNIHDPLWDGVSRAIFENGCWECSHLTDMLNALSSYPDAYFLDIGGNIGMWTLVAATANYQTFTIEALSTNVERICNTVVKNSFQNRTHLMHVAATDVPGQTFSLNVPIKNKGGTRVIAVGNDTTKNNEDNEVVKGVMVDLLKLPIDRPVVIKLDVEGHELQALMGARNFLKQANIVYFMMELRPNLHKEPRWKEIFDILTSKRLKPVRINYEDETELDVNRLAHWKHFKHPMVKYYDVVWRKDSFNTTMWQ